MIFSDLVCSHKQHPPRWLSPNFPPQIHILTMLGPGASYSPSACDQPEAAAELQGCSRELFWTLRAQKGEQTLRSSKGTPGLWGTQLGSSPTKRNMAKGASKLPSLWAHPHTTVQPVLAMLLMIRNSDPMSPPTRGPRGWTIQIIRKIFLPWSPSLCLPGPSARVLFWP